MPSYRYTVVLEPEEEGGFHVYCPALKGCHSQGDTQEDALRNIEEAIALYLESLKAHGEDTPEDDVVIKPVNVAVSL